MSRCLPFPPPGYEKKNKNDDTELSTKAAATPAGLIASEEWLKAGWDVVKVTEIEPAIETTSEIEALVSSLVEEVTVAEKTVDQNPAAVEKSEKELTVRPNASEPEPESKSTQLESKEVENTTQVVQPRAEAADLLMQNHRSGTHTFLVPALEEFLESQIRNHRSGATEDGEPQKIWRHPQKIAEDRES